MKFLELLKDLGLSEKEARVYLSCLQLGPATVLKISKATEIKRSTVYSIVDRLLDTGLLREELQGSKKRIVAEDPEALSRVLERKKHELEAALPELRANYLQISPRESFIQHYQGIDGIKQLSEQLLKELKSGDFFYVMSDQEKWMNMDAEYFRDWRERRLQMNLKVKLLLRDTPLARKSKASTSSKNEEIRLLRSSIELNTNLIVVPDKVITLQTVYPHMGVVIENKSIVRMNTLLFNTSWESAAAD